MANITFKADKTKVTEHEHVTVEWDCPSPDQVTLTVEDGGKNVYQLADSGRRVVEASGYSDKMVLTLRASIGGKTHEKSITVKVNRKVVEAEAPRRSSRSSGSSGSFGSSSTFSSSRSSGSGGKKFLDFSKLKNWWARTTAGFKTAWTYMPENKKFATKILGLMCAVMLLTSFFPKLLPFGLIAIMGYLTWVIIKR